MSHRVLRPLALALMLAAAPGLPAQQRIEQQMTPEQFKAAGLDRLTPEELENLNRWLNRTIDTQVQTATTEAKAQAKEEVKRETRGFFSFGSDEPIVAHIAGEFRGFAKNRQWTLDNGQVWQQRDDAQLAGVRRTNPAVTIRPGVGNSWWMTIEGYNTRAQVYRVK